MAKSGGKLNHKCHETIWGQTLPDFARLPYVGFPRGQVQFRKTNFNRKKLGFWILKIFFESRGEP